VSGTHGPNTAWSELLAEVWLLPRRESARTLSATSSSSPARSSTTRCVSSLGRSLSSMKANRQELPALTTSCSGRGRVWSIRAGSITGSDPKAEKHSSELSRAVPYASGCCSVVWARQKSRCRHMNPNFGLLGQSGWWSGRGSRPKPSSKPPKPSPSRGCAPSSIVHRDLCGRGARWVVSLICWRLVRSPATVTPRFKRSRPRACQR